MSDAATPAALASPPIALPLEPIPRSLAWWKIVVALIVSLITAAGLLFAQCGTLVTISPKQPTAAAATKPTPQPASMSKIEGAVLGTRVDALDAGLSRVVSAVNTQRFTFQQEVGMLRQQVQAMAGSVRRLDDTSADAAKTANENAGKLDAVLMLLKPSGGSESSKAPSALRR